VADSGIDVIEGSASMVCMTRSAFEDGPAAQVGEGVEQDVDPEFETPGRNIRQGERPEARLAHLVRQFGEAIHKAGRAGVFAVGAEAAMAAVGSYEVGTTTGLAEGRPAPAILQAAGHIIESDRVGRVRLVAVVGGLVDQ
jgi:hypothetical protein